MTTKKKAADADVTGAAETDARSDAAADAADAAEDSTLSSAEYTVAFSPRQVAVGLAIVAGLVAIAFRHRRSRDRTSADD